MSGWDDPETTAYYEAFCRRHSRYLEANRALIEHAHLAPGMRVLDLAAGTGRTAKIALPELGEDGRVLSVEPSAAMHAEGMRRVTDARVQWTDVLPRAGQSFDRILCGAAIWQFEPLAETFGSLARLLRPGGALCFNLPALYLLEPDEPGGGSDPLLLSLPAALMALDGSGAVEEPSSGESSVMPQSPVVERCRSAGRIVVLPRAADAGCLCRLAENSGRKPAAPGRVVPERAGLHGSTKRSNG
jgi:SAM-dependent methyltransferase